MNRRDTLKFLAGATAFAGTAGVLGRGSASAQAKPFTLPPLGYANDALEPHIDAGPCRSTTTTTTRPTSTTSTPTSTSGRSWRRNRSRTSSPISSAVPEAVRTPVRNNLGGHWNHTFFWELMTPGGAKAPAGDLKAPSTARSATSTR